MEESEESRYGNSFHILGPLCENAASLLEKLHLGGIFNIKKSSSNLELRRLICLNFINSFKYSGARLLTHLNTSNAILNFILYLTGKKCNFLS